MLFARAQGGILSAMNWKESASSLRKNEKITSFVDKLGQQFSAFFNGADASSNDLIGLDIGSDRIKLLKFNLNTSPVQIVDYDTTSLPPGVIVKDEIKNPAVIGAALKDM